jgi:hypothetical protein
LGNALNRQPKVQFMCVRIREFPMSERDNVQGEKSQEAGKSARVKTSERPTLPPPVQKLAYTIPEAAQLSSLGQTSIYKAIKGGQLRCRKYGTRSIITDPDLTSFLDNLPIDTKKARES